MLCSSNTCFRSNFFEDLVCTRQDSLILSHSFSFSPFLISFSLSRSHLLSKHSHLILSLTLSFSHSYSHPHLAHANRAANMRKHDWKCLINVLIHDVFISWQWNWPRQLVVVHPAEILSALTALAHSSKTLMQACAHSHRDVGLWNCP